MTGGAASGDDHDLSVRAARAHGRRRGEEGELLREQRHVAVWRLCVLNRMHRTQASDAGGRGHGKQQMTWQS